MSVLSSRGNNMRKKTITRMPGQPALLAGQALRRGALVMCAALASAAWSASASAATYTTFDPPGSVDTSAVGVNAGGTVTGYYYDGTDYHGFVRTADGAITTFDIAGSLDIYAPSINSGGAIAGYYEDTGLREHGFVRTTDGTITTFDAPGAVDTLA